MGFVKEFKEFAIKGNAIDLAVGVIIGGAFGKIVDSIISDLIMPVISKIIGKPDFTSLWVDLNGKAADGLSLEDARKVAGSDIFAYGNFITIAINFLLLALVIFLLVKSINRLKKKQADAPAAPSSTDALLIEIRDELKAKKS
ncbi:MAG: large conductance mechanosensitive channel protein MscL [Arachidicoccus sp.]|nr:large conductance mechanosensitive channel protein MscL [Arachidicoccus sp.]